MDLQDIEKYRERLENEYLDLLSYRQGILNQIEIDEKQLNDIRKQKEAVIKEVGDEIIIANTRLLEIKREREDYVSRFIDKEQEISANLIHIEEREQQLKRELEDFSRTKESYTEAIDLIEKDRIKLKEDKTQMEIEKMMIKRMEEMEEYKLADLEEVKLMLERKKGYQNKIIKALKIQGLKLDQKGEEVKKTKDFLINKAEAQEKERLHIESRQRQIKSAIIKLKELREAQ